MRNSGPVSIDYLKQFLRTDPQTGKVYWLPREGSERFNTWLAGREALNIICGNGYYLGEFLGRKYLAHIVIWAIHHGRWPYGQIDHANGIKTDNRLSNLREVTHSENQQNRGAQRNNTSGYKGVSLNKRDNLWHAQIRAKGKKTFLGSFKTPEAAHAAYCAAAKRLHGEFARTA